MDQIPGNTAFAVQINKFIEISTICSRYPVPRTKCSEQKHQVIWSFVSSPNHLRGMAAARKFWSSICRPSQLQSTLPLDHLVVLAARNYGNLGLLVSTESVDEWTGLLGRLGGPRQPIRRSAHLIGLCGHLAKSIRTEVATNCLTRGGVLGNG